MDVDILGLLTTYQLPAIFLGAFFFGETVIVSAAFLAGQGLWSLGIVFSLAFLGTIISDLIWFLFGTALLKLFMKWKRSRKKVEELKQEEVPLQSHTPFFVLLFIKFLYGTRILTIIYIASRKMNFWLFLLYDAIGTVLWLCVMLAIGWAAARGTHNWSPLFERTGYALGVLAITLILAHIVITWISKRVLKK
ncbi:MAG: hypothetical protein UV82_C0013G0035 [Candidatus Magasanikbacteria bacterium GW2011_GWD2_43_18]|uniref:VTT domain-containing protein n=1 Tax=Candidatus Magasanikbacteria bacterium GW2011_GWE2_42_7 TaxID=1619052 RepID=A0A0G1BCL2_9BACT|nr:MAG: hypothetical protein UV18_C0002G0112 [Candidatus Magasanikbacteria bacterium GW2011_GWC2_42_27]KKS70934.1 MAG: hypothetical protein UV42_C0040G0004 [Candidatus Magasanikbacteria bacterium GW2011_GWE2_42_7]KKT03951.1 MAG: hypothetical protein UV82_C0013G0035 [Candidatus Magasanikbacteria bacterium GW2011_GWD2_43_18]KKT25566.1 MAG: hypothetical protein UW10_C0006G0032 [Candidatus Magasanikbacteria bacterium GW2011_GWA2_43_9]HBB37747.1 hypothetical protein [Candidatus Magasanikbacteria bac